jgi:hypothetical protein
LVLLAPPPLSSPQLLTPLKWVPPGMGVVQPFAMFIALRMSAEVEVASTLPP